MHGGSGICPLGLAVLIKVLQCADVVQCTVGECAERDPANGNHPVPGDQRVHQGRGRLRMFSDVAPGFNIIAPP